jgi:thioredoxin-like negative regulator of GroEL
MGFWRKQVIEFALDHQTVNEIREQQEWIAREPRNPRPLCNLARLYRMQSRQDDALRLLLDAIALDLAFAPAHIELAEMYAVRGDHAAAWLHARAAERSGENRAVALLERYGVAEPPNEQA